MVAVIVSEMSPCFASLAAFVLDSGLVQRLPTFLEFRFAVFGGDPAKHLSGFDALTPFHGACHHGAAGLALTTTVRLFRAAA